MQALSNLLINQTLAYAFPFSSFEFPTDINVIVLSVGGKSLLPVRSYYSYYSFFFLANHTFVS